MSGLIVNLDRQEYLDLSQLGCYNSESFTEISQNSYVAVALEFLLSPEFFEVDILGSSWVGDRLEIFIVRYNEVFCPYSGRNRYEVAKDEYNDITEEVMQAISTERFKVLKKSA